MTLWQDVVFIGAIVCLVFAILVALYCSWFLFFKRRALFTEPDTKYHEQLGRVEKRLKERE
jgi:hypothetical protein